MPKIIASLFSGCGGLDLGFTGGFTFRGQNYDRLNTEILFANDFDQDAQSCYNANPLLTNDGVNCILADIRDIDANEIHENCPGGSNDVRYSAGVCAEIF